jgi:hypothetical protein
LAWKEKLVCSNPQGGKFQIGWRGGRLRRRICKRPTGYTTLDCSHKRDYPSYPIMQGSVCPSVRPCVRRKTPSWYMRAVQPHLGAAGRRHFRRKCRLPPRKKIPPIFFFFFYTALNAWGAEISSGGRRPPSPPQELEVRCAKRSLTSSTQYYTIRCIVSIDLQEGR